MHAGDLNRRVRIDQRAGTGTLNDPLTWAPLATVWCSVKMLTGKETLLADSDVASATASLRIRYRTDITNGMRAVVLKFVDRVAVDDVVFNILAPLPNLGSREYTDLACSALANNG